MNPISLQIENLKTTFGSELLILGHYYQRDDVLQHAHYMGDSLELSRRASTEKHAERIVFCGVHFMAESADLLTEDRQAVYLPDRLAGCPMADMAPVREADKVWEDLSAVCDDFLPVVYVNSSAAIKAFCGRNGGATCTSSNAGKVMNWVFRQDRRVLFLPDEHLGVNTLHDLNFPDDEVAVYDPGKPLGGLSTATIRRVKALVWKGYCHVHQFTTEDLMMARSLHPTAKVIVHPETPKAVLRLADAHGSTSQIIQYVNAAPAGDIIVIGTEIHLVDRLARQHQGRLTLLPLRPSACRNMALTTEEKLLALLTNWPHAQRVHVPPELKSDARAALTRMLEL